MGIEEEGSNAQGQNGNPEVDEMGNPNGEGDVQQHDQGSHSEINAGPGESRIENAKRDTRGGESSTSRNITGSTECQVGEDGVCVNLSGEYFKDR